MRERCERHALALGPSGCPICRREQAEAEATSSGATVAAVPSAGAPLASAAPDQAKTLPDPSLPDSAPTTPTVSDAPARPRLNVRVHPAALLLVPLLGFGLYWAASSGSPPAAHEGASAAEVSRAALDRTGAEAPATTLEDDAEPGEVSAPGDPAEPVEDASVIAARTVALERTRAQAQHAAQQLDAARSKVKVILYTSERCTRCTEARSHLVAQGIYPTERDIDKDARARARHRALTRKGGLPTLEVDGKVLVGFQPERLDKAIQRATTVRLTPPKVSARKRR